MVYYVSMRKLLIFLVCFFCNLLLFTSTVEAHVLVRDKNIGAVLHIDPDDDPIAGQQSGFFFEFKDTTNKFRPENCDCNFIVSENGQTVYSQPLFQNNDKPTLTNASIFYTFPKRDVYQILVVGKPNTSGAFQPFTLHYDIRVDRVAEGNATTTQNNNSQIIYMWSTIFLITVAFSIFMVYKNNSKKKKSAVRKHD